MWRLLFIYLILSSPVFAQEGYWIEQRWQDPESKQWCCNLADCKKLNYTPVVGASGYYLSDTGETIPHSRVIPSQDGEYWTCRYLTESTTRSRTRCFFAPQQSM